MNAKTIVFGMEKGGVGKTTLSLNFAAILAAKSYKTLIVDMDTQGTATSYFFEHQPTPESSVAKLYDLRDDFNIITEDDSFIYETETKNLYIAPSSLALAEVDKDGARIPESYKRLRLWIDGTAKHMFDYIIIDCPPSMSFIAQNTMIAGDYVIIPTLPVPESFDAIKLYIGLLKRTKRLNPNLTILGAVINRYVENRTVFSLYTEKFKESGVPVLAIIHDTIDFPKLAHNRKFITDFKELKKQRIGKEFSKFVCCVLKQISKTEEK